MQENSAEKQSKSDAGEDGNQDGANLSPSSLEKLAYPVLRGLKNSNAVLEQDPLDTISVEDDTNT